jgi:hypothetical protein
VRLRAAAILLLAAPVWAGEPLAGKWLMKSQEVAGQATESNPLVLAITPSGEAFDFAFIVTANSAQAISLKFTARLDGTQGEITGPDGKSIGTAKVQKDGASRYRVLLEGPNRPAASGHMTVSADGKTLISESDVKTPSGMNVHTVQVFARQ